jgi:hypothetical protein
MTTGAGGRDSTTRLRCAVCGEPIKPRRGAGGYLHASRAVAACDLDSDHEPVPGEPDRTTPEGGT